MNDYYKLCPDEDYTLISNELAEMLEDGRISPAAWGLFSLLVNFAKRGKLMTRTGLIDYSKKYGFEFPSVLETLAELETAGLLDDTLRAVITDY